MCVCIYAYARIMCVLGFVFLFFCVCVVCASLLFLHVCFGNLSAQVKSTFKPLLRSAPVT